MKRSLTVVGGLVWFERVKIVLWYCGLKVTIIKFPALFRHGGIAEHSGWDAGRGAFQSYSEILRISSGLFTKTWEGNLTALHTFEHIKRKRSLVMLHGLNNGREKSVRFSFSSQHRKRSTGSRNHWDVVYTVYEYVHLRLSRQLPLSLSFCGYLDCQPDPSRKFSSFHVPVSQKEAIFAPTQKKPHSLLGTGFSNNGRFSMTSFRSFTEDCRKSRDLPPCRCTHDRFNIHFPSAREKLLVFKTT